MAMTEHPQNLQTKFWLTLACIASLALTCILLAVFLAGLGPRYDELVTVCTESHCIPLTLRQPDVDELHEHGLSLHSFAMIHIILELFLDLPMVFLAFGIFWQPRNDLMGIQNFIDRHFYRAKYDAEQTLDRIATTTRDEVDMERLAAALLGVVEEMMQPKQVRLWLKPTGDSQPLTRT